MARFYKALNKRLIPRATGGQFRRTTIEDFGMAHCESCHSIYTPDLRSFSSRFIDPFAMADARKACTNCGHVQGSLLPMSQAGEAQP
jgi:hypothetical protein